MTGHDHHRTFRVANHMLGHTSEQHTIESGATMSRDYHQIDYRLVLPHDRFRLLRSRPELPLRILLCARNRAA